MTIHSPLLTDLYQINMAAGYYELGLHEREAVFHLFFRSLPFEGRYAIACGLSHVIEYLEQYRFDDKMLDYLRSLKDNQGKPFLTPDFLNYLKVLRFNCDLSAIPEGRVVFPHEPLLKIQGPLLLCQLLETPLVNLLDFSTLVATKASRVCEVAGANNVVEFGLRRAPGPDGGLTASRAAYVGGCESTSNTLAGMCYDIPVRGTVAHSWTMVFADEVTAMREYAKARPNQAVLLVDTYDTIQGVKHAILVAKELQAKGYTLSGIRLDSGDLGLLSQQARQLLDEAGLHNTKIFASGDLDEYRIAALKQQNAPIDLWGVGTRLSTAYGQPSLGAVYKLAAIQNEQQQWQYKMKTSDSTAKATDPGRLQVRRFWQNETPLKDIIYDVDLGISEKLPPSATTFQDCLVPIFERGQLVYNQPTIHAMRELAQKERQCFQAIAPEKFSVSLEENLQQLKENYVNTL